QPFRRDDEGDRLADGFLTRVAEEALSPGVPGADDAVEGLTDDGVVRGLDDGSGPRPDLLRPLARGDIAEDQDCTDRTFRLMPHGCSAIVNGPLGAVAGDED